MVTFYLKHDEGFDGDAVQALYNFLSWFSGKEWTWTFVRPMRRICPGCRSRNKAHTLDDTCTLVEVGW